MIDLCTDIGYHSLLKYGEQLCGDSVEVVAQGEDSMVVVLADGLGSGVKANILSTLTSKIISTMMANHMSVEDCVSTIASTLPVCEVRKIAYSTFTIIRIDRNKEAEIIQYDNPDVILLRNGKRFEFDKQERVLDGKKIYQSRVPLEENDLFLAMSDGTIHAGVGAVLNFGWQRDEIIEFMETMYNPDFTAKTMATILLDQCNKLYDGKPGDDTTVCAVKIRHRQPVNLMLGPPADPADLADMQTQFFSQEGKHIVCGGTTSQLAAEFLGKTVEPQLDYVDADIPPIAKIDGVDLVTEGVITMSRVLSYAQNYIDNNEQYQDWGYKKDGASRIARMLFEQATDIHFYVGRAVNPAHQNPDLPINFNIKMRLVEELSECLKQMNKRITVYYF